MADETPKKRRGRPPLPPGIKGNYRTPAKAMLGRTTPPIDEADVEVHAAINENRPVDIVRAFPEPPPPIAQQEADGGTRPPVELAEPEVLGEVQQVADLAIVRRRSRLPLPETSEPPTMPRADATPAERYAQVGVQSNEYAMEFRLKLVHRMLMRNVPLDMIAAQLQVSVKTVQNMRTELGRRLVYESQTINRYEIAGKTMAFYDEVQGMALRMADEAAAKPYVKLQALQTALGAQADRQRFLTASGFWSNAPFVPQDATEDDATRSVSKLHTLIEAVLNDQGEAVMDEYATQENVVQGELDGKVRLL